MKYWRAKVTKKVTYSKEFCIESETEARAMYLAKKYSSKTPNSEWDLESTSSKGIELEFIGDEEDFRDIT